MNSKMIANGIIRAVVTLLLAALLLYALYLLKSLIIYIVISLVITLIGKPIVRFLYKKVRIRNRVICVVITMLLFLIISLGVFSLFIPLLIAQSQSLSLLDIDQLKINMEHLMQQIVDNLGIEKVPPLDVSKMLKAIDFPGIINSTVGFIGSFGMGFFSVLFISFFFLKDGSKMLQSILALISRSHIEQSEASIEKTNDLLSRYFVGIILQIGILFVIYTIVLLIFGVQNAFIIAFLCSLLNLIPYIGPVIGFGLMAFLTMTGFIGNDFSTVMLPKTIYVMIGFLIGQLIDNFFSQPLIFSNSVKSSPLEIFLVIIASGTLFGITGMVVAVPAYTVIKVVLKEFFDGNKFVDYLTKNM
ncbi:AI-2E family transporter [Capnocytophaga canimorsus]|uniref:AI-2E family transporter n=1 Tax=Capnocytophaga canimorsus TaxID=28188 RepID=A0A250G1Y0_9FLAO|nr:AI-2E family transporter [Capnocytophaga canimorsus]ATA91419.1 AI-2E family transporter [Capnocytophaga canimorsus]MDT9499673.1 AI-2E family transporter [Capnocytophaga canimorsus]GIM55907.1 AI-2E family transporter [Capnocytophaga canimorsus]